MPQHSLKTKAAKGMVWSAFGSLSYQVIGFVIGIILARLLLPSDYGLIGMLAIFLAISQLFVESGFSNALIQKIDRTEIDFSTIFYFNIFISVTIYFILFITAPLIAIFFNTPQLTALTRFLSLCIIIDSFAIVQQARLSIKLDFKTPALLSLIAIVISGSTGIILAYNGFGVWALVIQALSGSLIKTLLFFYFSKWTPSFIFSIKSLKNLFRFSSKLLAAGFITTIVTNLYTIFIGKIFSAKDLGFYTRAKQFPELLAITISSVIQGVTFPILTSLQNENERMVSVYRQLMRMSVFIVFPCLTLFALISEPFVRFFLTEKWMPIVPLIQWLCFARMITPISLLNMNILNAVGRSDLYFKLDVYKLPITLCALLITVPFGLKAVMIGHLATNIICFFINTHYPGKMFRFGAIRQIKEMREAFIATIIMSIFVFSFMQFVQLDILKILLGTIIGVVIYLFSAYLLKIEELKELKELLVQIIAKTKK